MARAPVVLLVTRNFPPLLGGMERLNLHVFQEIDRTYNAWLIGPEGASAHVTKPEQVLTCAAAPISRFLICATHQAGRLALRVKPDLIIAGSGVTAWPAWLAARLCGARLVIYLHGLDIVVDSFWYRQLFIPIIRRADVLLANSRATALAAQAAGMDTQRIHILHPGVTLPEALPESQSLSTWRTQMGLGNRPILLSVGRITRRKGLAEFVRHALPNILAKYRETLLVIVGEEPGAALAAKGGLSELQDTIRDLGIGNSVRFLGKLSDDSLANAYIAADVLIFPVLDITGDMEGFGMVAIEAAAHGTPTVAFSVGGVPDAIAEGVSGNLIQPGNYSEFAETVAKHLGGEIGGIDPASCRTHAEQYSWPRFGERLRGVFSHALKIQGAR